MTRIELNHRKGQRQTTPRRRKARAGLLLAVGCITSPCCTPLLVPLAITLLAGTPIAAILTRYVGWVYALLTLVSLVTLFFGIRHLWPLFSAQPAKRGGSVPDHPSQQESGGVPVKLEA